MSRSCTFYQMHVRASAWSMSTASQLGLHHDRSKHSSRGHRPGHHVLRGRQARRARTARDPGQRRGRSSHAERRAAGRQRRGRGQGGHEGHEQRGRSRGRVRQARHGPSRLSSRDRRQAVSARGDPGLDPQQAPRRRHAADRAVRQGGDHGAGLFRRGPPQGHAGRRIHGRLRSAGHHQRADRGGRGLRLPAGLSQRLRQHRPAAAGAGLRPGRRHVRRHRDGDPRQRVPGPGHRRRRAPWAATTGTSGC